MRTQPPKRIRNADLPSDAIIRFPNRRMYSLATRGYVTFEDFGEMIAQGRGHEIKVFDRKTRSEVTDQVLASCLERLVRSEQLVIPRAALLALLGGLRQTLPGNQRVG